MKAECIIDYEHCISKGKSYIVLGGEYSVTDNKTIIDKIRIQCNDGSIALYDSNIFNIDNKNIDKYIFDPVRREFAFETIAYFSFLSMLYEDRKEYISDYYKAKKDLQNAKLYLYDEYNFDDLNDRILCGHSDERDFIFTYLKNKGDKRFIDLAVKIVKDTIKSNDKSYNVVEILKYLSVFDDNLIREFMMDYMINDYFGDDEISNIVYNYKFYG